MGYIFISYDDEDKSHAIKIYERLQTFHLSPWIDVRNIMPGQDWKTEINKAIRHSDVFIACLSSRSVSKRGYAQAQLNSALEILETIPESDIFIIPLKLDECEVPEKLSELQSLNYFESGARDKLINTIWQKVNRGDPATKLQPKVANSTEKDFFDAEQDRDFDATMAYSPGVDEHPPQDTGFESQEELRENLLDQISESFIYHMEKELILQMDKYFLNPNVAKQQPNYLAIFYFSQEVEEINRLSEQVYELYTEIKNNYLTNSLLQQLRDSLKSVSKHRELTAGLVREALAADPEHYLGKSLQMSLEEILDSVATVKIALTNKADKHKLMYATLKLHQLLNSLESCMKDMRRYLGEHLHF